MMVEGPLSADRARGEGGAPTGKAATAAGTTSFLEGRGGITDRGEEAPMEECSTETVSTTGSDRTVEPV